MRLFVNGWNQEQDYHDCLVDGNKNNKIRVDLFVSGCFPVSVSPGSLIGKWVDVEYTNPYISIAYGVSIVEE